MAVKLPVKPKIEPVNEEVPPEFVEFETTPPGFEVLDAHRTPNFPAKTIRADKDHLFFDWVSKLVADDWNHIVVYVYREFPVIDRQQTNTKAVKNIDCLSGPFDKDYIVSEHGSGKYQFLVNDVNKAVKGKGGTVGYAYTDIEDPNNPPKIVLDELVIEHPSNRRYVAKLKAEGKLTVEGIPMSTQGGSDNAALIALLAQLVNKTQQQNNQPPQKDQTLEAVTNIFSKTHEASMSMMKDQARTDSPDTLVKMLAALKEMMPQQASGNESLGLILTMQTNMAKVQAEAQASREAMMVKMMEMMNAKPSGEDQEDKILARIAVYKDLFGGGEGGGNSKKGNIWETLIEHGAPVLGKVVDTVQGFVNMKNFAAGLAKQQAQAQPITEVPAIEPAVAQEPSAPNNVVEMPKQTEVALEHLIRGPVGPLIRDALNSGKTGDMFAEAIETMMGKLEYEKIAEVGKDKIIAAMQAVPEFWSLIVPSSINKFVDDFIAYGSEDIEEEEKEAIE